MNQKNYNTTKRTIFESAAVPRNFMKGMIVVLTSVVLAFMGGCLSDPIARTTVILNFPASNLHTNTTISISRPEIQDAMRIIDAAFAANGFTRDDAPLKPQDQAQGIIASYGRNDVLISGNELIVNFVEFGKLRPSPIVVKTCGMLKEKLANLYGTQNVHIERETAEMETR